MASKRKPVTKSREFDDQKAKKTLQAAAGITIEGAVKKITDAQLGIGKTLSDVTSTLQAQLQELSTVEGAVQLKKEELETIFGKEQVLKSIDELGVELAQRQQEYNDQNFALSRAREQDEADFVFERDQTRRGEAALYEESRRLIRNQHRDEDEARGKVFLAREEALKARENELVELRSKVTAFPEELKKVVDKQVAIATNSVMREFEHKLQLMQKDAEAASTIHANTVGTLNSRLANQDKIISDLTARLASSEEKVSTIATKALEAASATKSLADMQNLIQTQSNGQSARKA